MLSVEPKSPTLEELGVVLVQLSRYPEQLLAFIRRQNLSMVADAAVDILKDSPLTVWMIACITKDLGLMQLALDELTQVSRKEDLALFQARVQNAVEVAAILKKLDAA
ncbi:MAG: hypothetical protein AAB853_04235 [Patescibacteria group bacterium]